METNLDQQLDKILSKMAFKCAGGITDDGAKEYIPAKQAIKALIATEVLRARLDERTKAQNFLHGLAIMPVHRRIFDVLSTNNYDRLAELEAQLNKSFSYQITKSNKEIKTQLEDKS